ncbi:hypothetical protein CK203_025819 [Vitis vinifera]|uniref:Uncharacterized protein n=2 Tax=Vitis vinifera TaxID=29760 RepID=F6H9C4_VITVI|nr:hypothetical protein CK203_025819 [Vitis vinifera]|eukprot:XP_002263191.1 PREDICTED: uncharacterized protein LOC100261530 [Vitis vinifera]
MARATARIPAIHRNFLSANLELGFTAGQAASLSDMAFGFLEDGEGWPESFSSTGGCSENGALDDDEDDADKEKNSSSVEENKNFWESQHQILHTTLCRTSSLELGIRNATKEALKEIQMDDNVCVCLRPVVGGCRSCLLREVSDRLRNAGYNSAICKSKWRSSPNIPSGEHTFLDVVHNSSAKKGEVRVIIELNFRAEFEMARASEEYNRLIRRLPEVFVGKVERLHTLVKILCMAAKKCMKEKKMHMGPWRKHRYMQAKWLSTCVRSTSTSSLLSGDSGRLPKPKASMLTVDLMEKLPNMHCTAVEVV